MITPKFYVDLERFLIRHKPQTQFLLFDSSIAFLDQITTDCANGLLLNTVSAR